MQEDVVMKLPEVAELLDVHFNTIRKWSNSGYLPSTRTDGGHRRWKEKHVLDFMARERKNLRKIALAKRQKVGRDFLDMFCKDQKDYKKVLKIVLNGLIK